MDNGFPKRVEDYTTANLVLILINMLWIFAVIWSAWGLSAVLLLAAILNHAITRFELSKRRRDGGMRQA